MVSRWRFSLRFYSTLDLHRKVKMLKQVVFRTDFTVDQKLLFVNQWVSRKIEWKKVEFFLTRRQVKNSKIVIQNRDTVPWTIEYFFQCYFFEQLQLSVFCILQGFRSQEHHQLLMKDALIRPQMLESDQCWNEILLTGDCEKVLGDNRIKGVTVVF